MHFLRKLKFSIKQHVEASAEILFFVHEKTIPHVFYE